MALTKIGSIGINTGISLTGVTTIVTLNASDNVLSVGGTVNFVSDVSIGGTVSIAGTLTYEDVTNVDAVGLITARDGIVVGSGITLSPDGHSFHTGVVTATAFHGSGASLTGIDASAIKFGGAVKAQANNSGVVITGVATATKFVGDGSDLTGLPSGSEFKFGTAGITTVKNLGIQTTTVDNYETVGAANSFRGIYIGDGSLVFNARLDNINGYYIGTGRNALNAGPIILGSTMILDCAWVIV